LLRRLGDLISDKEYVELLARAEVQDNGKPIGEMRNQMRSMAEWYYYYAGLADKLGGEVLHADRADVLNYARYEPLGVVAIIVPWNSPLRLMSWKLAPALAAGNTAVVKPSEFSSTSAIIFMQLLEKAKFPPGVVNVVTGLGAEAGAALAGHPAIAKVAFTGGEGGGRAAYIAAAHNLKAVALELGGKSPNIVFQDANLENAAKAAVAGIFGSGGQTCVAGSRLLVQETIYDALAKRVVELASKIVLGDPLDPATNIGPVANEPQFQRILGYIDVARKDGANLALGGKAAEGPKLGRGLFIEPTVFTGVRNDMRIAQEEVFGPILCVIPFRDEGEAVRISNDTQYGLAAGVWTRDLSRAHRMAARLQAGTVWINTYRLGSQLSPFGGYKNSGLGREGGVEMLKGYMQTKSIWVDLSETYSYPFAS
jgi:aldehyde dehydrogenase (NAD+)